MVHLQENLCFFHNAREMNTFTIVILGLCSRLVRRISLFERSPLEVPLVPSTLHLAPFTLQAGRFGLVALQAFGFASDTSWKRHSRLRERSAPCALWKSLTSWLIRPSPHFPLF